MAEEATDYQSEINALKEQLSLRDKQFDEFRSAYDKKLSEANRQVEISKAEPSERENVQKRFEIEDLTTKHLKELEEATNFGEKRAHAKSLGVPDILINRAKTTGDLEWAMAIHETYGSTKSETSKVAGVPPSQTRVSVPDETSLTSRDKVSRWVSANLPPIPGASGRK